MTAPDPWAQWLLYRRHGGDAAQLQAVLDWLYPVRDKVLAHAGLRPGESLLDVGCGDGLIGFGALSQTPESRVIFSDIAPELLAHVESLARELGVRERCRFLRASAGDLSALADGSLDAIATRSVLIYVDDKRRALAEFKRVLRPGGRLSLFEPINRFMADGPPHLFYGYEAGPVQALADKVLAFAHPSGPPNGDSMLNFDERDMVAWVEEAGFRSIQMELQVKVGPAEERVSWPVALHSAPNPRAPTLEEAMRRTLTPDEIQTFSAYLRPLFEAGLRVERSALMYLWAVR